MRRRLGRIAALLLFIHLSMACSQDVDSESEKAINDNPGYSQNGETFAPVGAQGGLPPGQGGCRAIQDSFNSSTRAQGAAKIPILGSVNFTLDISAQVNVQTNDTQGRVGINARIDQATPALAKGPAEKAIGAYRDPLQLELVPIAEQAGLPGYQGLDCVVAGVRSIRNNAMEFRYDPPLPFLGLPQGGGSAGTTVDFANITGTLVRHYESQARPGSYPGSARLTTGGGRVRIDFDFGSTLPSLFATPVASIEYQVSGDQFSGIGIEVFVSEGSKIPIQLQKGG